MVLPTSVYTPPLTEPTAERIVRLVSVHVGETDWGPTQAAMLVRYLELPFRLYTTVRVGHVDRVSETWRRITGDALPWAPSAGLGAEKRRELARPSRPFDLIVTWARGEGGCGSVRTRRRAECRGGDARGCAASWRAGSARSAHARAVLRGLGARSCCPPLRGGRER